ncbi:MAG: glycosyltransferase family 4 protein [Deltaproteobacteria bacterium]|nr:glycosyltransferase family 4 protein [Deltaproteobacteria bacterium]
MVKIFVPACDLVPGANAVGQHLSLLIPALAERAEVDAMTLKGEELAHIQRFGAARLMRVPTAEKEPTERVAAFQRAVARQLDNDSYDLVYCADLFSASTAVSANSLGNEVLLIDLFDLPSVSFVERHPGSDDRRWQQSVRRHEMSALMTARRIVVHSEAMRRYLLGLNVPQERIRHLPFGVTTAVFSPPSIEVRADPSACLIAAVIEPWSEALLAELLRVVTTLPRRVQVQLVTSDPVAGAVEPLAAQHGLQSRVRVERTTTAEQLASALGNVDVVVVWWGWSDKVIETGLTAVEALDALSCGRPVVATDGPGHRELLDRGELGRCVRRGDVEGLGKCLNELVASSALRKRLGTRGREFALDHCSWERVRQLYTELIEEELGVSIRGTGEPTPPSETTPADAIVDTPPASADYEVLHTPVVPRPAPAADRARGGAAVPAPIALGVSDQLEGGATGSDPWVHDTIAMPTQPDVMEAVRSDSEVVTAPGLRSVALMDSLAPPPGNEDQTDILRQETGSGDETERLEISESLVKRLSESREDTESDKDEATRLPAQPGDAPRAAAPENQKPAQPDAGTASPSVVEIGPGEFVALQPLNADESTDLDREAAHHRTDGDTGAPEITTQIPADGEKTPR